MRMGHELLIVCILPARSEPSKRTRKRTGTGATNRQTDKPTNLFRDLPLGREYHQAPERQNRKVDKRENLPRSRTCCYSTQPDNLTIESPKTSIPRGMLVLGDSMLACRSGARRRSLPGTALEGTRWKRAPERLAEGSSLRRLSQDSEGEVKTSELLHIFSDSLLLDTAWQLDNRVT
jgi:hypothetical protein